MEFMKILQGFYYKNKLKVTLRSAFNELPFKGSLELRTVVEFKVS